VLCPTRELASQIAESFRTYGRHLGMRQTIIFGGVNQRPQVDSLRRGTDIIVATPGRLLDLMNQGYVDLRGIESLVLDEADRMLDMGFINDIRKIVSKLGPGRQTMLFSATMPAEIRRLADSLLRDPVTVQVAPVSATADGVDQSVYFVEKRNKAALLAHLVDNVPMSRAIVFTRTKRGADRVVQHLTKSGIRSEAIHGNKSQNARERALKNFRSNKIPVLVATDIASRGIDVDGITHVVNFDLSDEAETYVHRIGRTARAGATGAAITLCSPDEISNLKAIERLIRRSIPVKNDHPTYSRQTSAHTEEPQERRQQHRSSERAHAPRQPHAPRPRPHSAQPHRDGAAPQPASRTGGHPQQRRPQAPRSQHPLHGAGRPHGSARPQHPAGRRHV
jgi:ATP-dependent RNA helicase RhlE